MHDLRNAALASLLVLAVCWGLVAWFLAPAHLPALPPSVLAHRLGAVLVALVLGLWLWCALAFEGAEREQRSSGGTGRHPGPP